MVDFRFGIIGWVVVTGCVASVLTLSSCKVATTVFKPKKEVKIRVIRTDSLRVEFVDTTLCPPNLTDTLVVTKRVVKTLPPQDVIIHDTVTVKRESVITRIVTNKVTKNNWWLLLIGMLIGWYGKNYLWRQRGSV